MSRYILVVDDDRDIRDSLVELLTEYGFPATGAGNGAEALEVLRTSAQPPALILLDLMMPVMDGREFRERQLENPAWTAIPVIVISAYNDVDRQAGALALDHLRKPLTVRSLLDTVRRHCASG
ncbi:MAG TPA: response regulator [Kofleriaceae bacterium]|jgi:CheY-like chemotaxis protein|nr:response regulator [Kofleriaceae bacterium]